MGEKPPTPQHNPRELGWSTCRENLCFLPLRESISMGGFFKLSDRLKGCYKKCVYVRTCMHHTKQYNESMSIVTRGLKSDKYRI